MVSIGLYKALRDKKLKTTFMKPVGQQYVNVKNMHIDKDSFLISKVFRSGRNLKDMSPITIGRGYTEQYILKPHKQKLKEKIESAFKRVIKGQDAIIVEGTGHAGVGSVIDFSNADVAHLLGSKVIIICGGGIGKSIDEIALNKAMFDLKKVDILGVIVNKVIPDKYDKIQKSLERGLKYKGIKLLGVIPEQPLLSSPTVEQIKTRLSLKVLCGNKNTNRRVKHAIVAAMEPHNMIHYIKDGTLVITSGDRVDNILVAVSSHLVRDGRSFQIAGIILTGGLQPNPQIIDLLKKSIIPILITEDDTYTVASKVDHLICKIQQSDKDKIEEATRLVKKYVDIKSILDAFKS